MQILIKKKKKIVVEFEVNFCEMLYMGVLVYFVMYLSGKNWPKRKEKGATKYKQIDYKSLKGYRAKREGRKKK